jgi:hypothetical protein
MAKNCVPSMINPKEYCQYRLYTRVDRSSGLYECKITNILNLINNNNTILLLAHINKFLINNNKIIQLLLFIIIINYDYYIIIVTYN